MGGTRFPKWFLDSQLFDDSFMIQHGCGAISQRRLTGLVGEDLPDGDILLAVLGELRPVARDSRVEVDQPTRVGEGNRHRGQALRGGVDEDERVLAPRLGEARIAAAAPEVDHLLAAVVDGTGRAELAPLREVPVELAADLLEPGGYEAA